MDVQGYGAAVVPLPLGSRVRRPLVVATHGNYDTPEWCCTMWGQIVARRAFVLCPRGVVRRDSPSPRDLVYEYSTVAALKREIEAGVAALQVLYEPWIDPGPRLYAGFSQGAIMGVAILRAEATRYPRAVLIEGGFESLHGGAAKAYAEAGGERVLFACGQWDCWQKSKQRAKELVRLGVGAEVVHGQGEGHTYGGRVAEVTSGAFEWLIEGDPRWRPPNDGE
jgi:predicted esterase